jgi:hypothetical protein
VARDLQLTARRCCRAAIAIFATACTHWRTVSIHGPRATRDTLLASDRTNARDVHVVLVDGESLHFQSATLHRDTLYGFSATDTVAIARGDVKNVEVWSREHRSVTPLGVLIVLAALVFIVWDLAESEGPLFRN